jgi:hypothetical protein
MRGITFIEIMIAVLVLGMFLIPVFGFLSGSVQETEKIYAEAVAISRAKLIMDTMMFQMPWRVIREGPDNGPCRFSVYKRGEPITQIPDARKDINEGLNAFLNNVVPKMFGEGTVISTTKNNEEWKGEGIFTTQKGIVFHARAQVTDLDEDTYGAAHAIQFKNLDPMTSGGKGFYKISELTPLDFDKKYNVMKKIVVQVKWASRKGLDVTKDKNARSVFLVGFKAALD